MRSLLQRPSAPNTAACYFSDPHLCGGAPVGIRLPDADADVEDDDDDEGDEGGVALHEEHDRDAEDGPQQRQPLVVVFEGGPPPGAVGHAGRGGTVSGRTL